MITFPQKVTNYPQLVNIFPEIILILQNIYLTYAFRKLHFGKINFKNTLFLSDRGLSAVITPNVSRFRDFANFCVNSSSGLIESNLFIK